MTATAPLNQTNLNPDLAAFHGLGEKLGAAVESGRLVLLFTDVDSTLVLGAGHTAAEIATGQQAMQEAVGMLNRSNALLIPITGSHFDHGTTTTLSIKDRIEQGVLPAIASKGAQGVVAEAYVTDGGARMLVADGLGAARDHEGYKDLITQAQFSYDVMLGRATKFLFETNRLQIPPEQAELATQYDPLFRGDRIQYQPGTVDGKHEQAGKIAFHFYATPDESAAILLAAQKSFPDAKLVCGEEKDANTKLRGLPELAGAVADGTVPLKYNLDIVPYNKGTPVEHLTRWIQEAVTQVAVEKGKPRPEMIVIACGDAGNDLPLVSGKEISHVVMVGGATKDLIQHAASLREQGKQVFVDTNPDRLGPASIGAALKEFGIC